MAGRIDHYLNPVTPTKRQFSGCEMGVNRGNLPQQ